MAQCRKSSSKRVDLPLQLSLAGPHADELSTSSRATLGPCPGTLRLLASRNQSLASLQVPNVWVTHLNFHQVVNGSWCEPVAATAS
ncbi:hypothetical protein HPP92_025512 [Vanilla planifolia]|uniref:Uncharacterized protein n=1 Tax=Vanilla planifolia TaxID=51239 RepID=A0A835PHP1_VANPL|nr:hypothetical protein HPP92_025512 [Vanilla planifolia]